MSKRLQDILNKGVVEHMNTVFLDICGCNLDDFTELGEQTSKICISQVLMDLLLSITVSLPTSKRPISFGSMLYFFSRELTTVKLQANSLLLIIQTTTGNIYLKQKLHTTKTTDDRATIQKTVTVTTQQRHQRRNICGKEICDTRPIVLFEANNIKKRIPH